MKTRRVVANSAAVLLGLLACAGSASELHVSVLSVPDGDTLSVRLPSGDVREVRLAGVDAPERGQPFADEARREARRLLPRGEKVRVQPGGSDDFGRLVARVFAGSTDVGRALVEGGFAWHFRRYSDDAALAAAEARARTARRGLWADAAAVAPWEWRAARRASPPPVSSPRGTAYVGNTRTLKFHAATCPHAGCPHCTRRFGARDTAVAAGFVPAGCCRP